ncbi:LytR C-terminal domain-containing protein [Rhodocaloribacter litoris]|nr:LytR C-terminal domain-containing protein [Rhodocaloribacter litoris]
MSKASTTRGGAWLNVALVVAGAALLLLLYALVARFLFPRTDPVREANPAGLVGEIIQVEVRNGCGVSGLAAQAMHYLRDHGFDVVEVGDHTSFDEAHSFVVDRVGDLEAARKVAHALGIPESRVRQEIRPDYYLDASVVIGKDYATLKPFRAD